MISLAVIAPNESREAYQWHRGFSGSNDSLFPRRDHIFRKIVADGHVWSARDERGDYVGLAYAHLDDQQSTWELGGLMVVKSQQGKGLGSVLMRLTLGHLLFEETPLAQGQKIIAHVLKDNADPRRIIQDRLKFKFISPLRIPASELPGLRANAEGLVEGDEFHIVVPESLIALAEWVEIWKSKLNNGEETKIILRPDISFKEWAIAFRSMAREHQ